jgi:lysophospholipase L1-like esterase
MQLLFIGNSLTRGQIGISYIDLLKADNPDWKIKNAGVDGDTLKNIADRVQKETPGTNYDYIIIEAGHNDIILPLPARVFCLDWFLNIYENKDEDL